MPSKNSRTIAGAKVSPGEHLKSLGECFSNDFLIWPGKMQGAPWPGGMIAVSRAREWIVCGFESLVRLKGFSKRHMEYMYSGSVLMVTFCHEDNGLSSLYALINYIFSHSNWFKREILFVVKTHSIHHYTDLTFSVLISFFIFLS